MDVKPAAMAVDRRHFDVPVLSCRSYRNKMFCVIYLEIEEFLLFARSTAFTFGVRRSNQRSAKKVYPCGSQRLLKSNV